jgi:hypothetical protein
MISRKETGQRYFWRTLEDLASCLLDMKRTWEGKVRRFYVDKVEFESVVGLC